MEVAVILLLIMVFMIFLSFSVNSPSEISRDKMKRSILDIEKILNLSDVHHEIELDRMSDQELTRLYQDSGEKFDTYIRERNAQNNEQALEEF